MKKIIIIAGNVRSLVANRGDLIKDLISKGYIVKAIVPKADFNESIKQLDIEYYKIDMSRQAINPFSDIRMTAKLMKILKKEKPDKVLSYTIKPVIFGSIAAKLAKVKNISSMITGLGYIYTGISRKQSILKFISNTLYRIALKFNSKVFFQNYDDLSYFKEKGLVKEKQIVKINGSGVNVSRFPFTPNHFENEINIIMIGRLIKDKEIGR